MEPPEDSEWRAPSRSLRDIGKLSGHVADRLLEKKTPEERLEHWEGTLRNAIRKHGPLSRQAAMSHWRVGQTLESLGRYDEARLHLEESFRAYRMNLGEDHLDTLVAEFNLAQNLFLSGHPKDAAPLCLHVGKVREGIYAPGSEEMKSVYRLSRMIREAIEPER